MIAVVIAAVVVAWCAVSLPVALRISRALARRNTQLPTPTQENPT